MATWANLVDQSNGDTLQESAIEQVQEGVDWVLYSPVYLCLDDNGEETEADLTDVTADWVIYDDLDGTELLTLTTTVVENQIKGTATAAQTAALAGDSRLGRRCPWSLHLTKDGITIPAWGPQDSVLVIKQGD